MYKISSKYFYQLATTIITNCEAMGTKKIHRIDCDS